MVRFSWQEIVICQSVCLPVCVLSIYLYIYLSTFQSISIVLYLSASYFNCSIPICPCILVVLSLLTSIVLSLITCLLLYAYLFCPHMQGIYGVSSIPLVYDSFATNDDKVNKKPYDYNNVGVVFADR